MKKLIIIGIIHYLVLTLIFSQNFSVNKIEPPNWWIGMKWDTLQLMVYGENLDEVSVQTESEDFEVLRITHPENKNYLFVDIIISSDATPDDYNLIFSDDQNELEYDYELMEREFQPEEHLGFTNEDVVYLIFIDRFNNGDRTNDSLEVSRDEFKFGDLNGRHGGDLQGVIDKLDYIKELGFTAIWMTPFLENDMHMSYHGYAATDLYKVDERFGSNELYKELVKKANEKGIKIIYDHVANHIGINHEWIGNLPYKDWINGSVENHLRTNHDKTSVVDIHSNENARSYNEDGWFTDYMIDLNQRNPFMANYIIQNTLWWIEYAGIDGIREDTYPYADQKFMAEWAKNILREYPNFNIVGEIWTGEPAFLAGWQRNSKVRDFETYLPSLMDFGMRDAFADYLSKERSLYEIYKTLAQDYLYSDIDNLMLFIDNHDTDRGMFIADSNVAKYKIALTILLTSRGIPQIFYGSELGINEGGHHGRIRKPFPGGFENDERNAFTEEGRTELENDIYDYLKTLLQLRKEYPALASSNLTHYLPYDETYVYFKKKDDQKIMVVVNNNDEEFEVKLTRMMPDIGENTTLFDLLQNENTKLNENGNLLLPAKTAKIYLLN